MVRMIFRDATKSRIMLYLISPFSSADHDRRGKSSEHRTAVGCVPSSTCRNKRREDAKILMREGTQEILSSCDCLPEILYRILVWSELRPLVPPPATYLPRYQRLQWILLSIAGCNVYSVFRSCSRFRDRSSDDKNSDRDNIDSAQYILRWRLGRGDLHNRQRQHPIGWWSTLARLLNGSILPSG